jgi:hypothetical protein
MSTGTHSYADHDEHQCWLCGYCQTCHPHTHPTGELNVWGAAG